MVHEFKESLERGEQWEGLLDQHFRRWFSVEPVSMELQRLGIDRVFTKENGQRFTIEYKTDERAHETGNVYIETISVYKENKIEAHGWAHTSTAQLLVYYIPGLKKAYIIDMVAMRDKLDTWGRQHKTANADNGSYVGAGLLVPIQKIEKLCRGVQHVPGPISGTDDDAGKADRQQDILRELGY